MKAIDWVKQGCKCPKCGLGMQVIPVDALTLSLGLKHYFDCVCGAKVIATETGGLQDEDGAKIRF